MSYAQTVVLVTVAFVVLAPVVFWIVARLQQRAARRRAVSRPFPDEWKRILEEHLPVYRRLPDPLRQRLHRLVLIFMAEKRFEACGGLAQVDESLRVLIAGQACLLLCGQKREEVFPGLHSILVYPSVFWDPGRRLFLSEHDDDYDEDKRLGESWESGSVVLAADSVFRGSLNEEDGLNLVLHEFAHQLDQLDGAGDGVPPLPGRKHYANWSAVFQDAFDDLQDDVERGRKSLLDPYGATNAAEFFAVATETFFEKTKALKKRHPDLHQTLAAYYQLDPLEWKEHGEP